MITEHVPAHVVQSWLTPRPARDDWRGFGPTHACPCGSTLFHMLASFEDGEVSFYSLDGQCAECGSVVTLPYPSHQHPLDR